MTLGRPPCVPVNIERVSHGKPQVVQHVPVEYRLIRSELIFLPCSSFLMEAAGGSTVPLFEDKFALRTALRMIFSQEEIEKAGLCTTRSSDQLR